MWGLCVTSERMLSSPRVLVSEGCTCTLQPQTPSQGSSLHARPHQLRRTTSVHKEGAGVGGEAEHTRAVRGWGASERERSLSGEVLGATRQWRSCAVMRDLSADVCTVAHGRCGRRGVFAREGRRSQDDALSSACEVVWGAHDWVLVHDDLLANRGIVVRDERSHCMLPPAHASGH